MISTRRLLFAGLISLGIGLPASHAQMGGGGGGIGGGGIGGGGIGGGGTSFGGGGGALGGGGGTSFSGGGGTSFSGGTNNSSTGGAGIFGGTTGSGTGRGGVTGGIDPSNFLRNTYSNPAYEGRPNQGSPTGVSPVSPTLTGVGGFGQSSLGTTTGTATTSTTRVGTASTSGSSTGFSAQQRPAARLMFSASVKFATKPINVSVLETELRRIIDRSTTLKNPADIDVAAEGQTIVLRGRVASDDERRLAEGLIRLTPGVRDVKNELIVR